MQLSEGTNILSMDEKIQSALKRASGHLTRHQLWEVNFNQKKQKVEDYWTEYGDAEQALVDAGRIERRRGRRGGIYLIDQACSDQQSLPKQIAEDVRLEKAAYKPALETILRHWKDEPGFTHVFGEITAGQGRRKTGGRWTRPDIVICTVSDWVFSSRPEGDVRTIEVKRFEALDVLAVYEALSHKNQAHYAYLLIVNFPKDLNEYQQELYDRVYALANQHGIGIITAEDTSDWDTWGFELDAMRSNADHQSIHNLVMDQLSREVRADFRDAIRKIVVQV
jgi:hypothetical protein